MSKTLFWYIFKDLLKIFFLASGAVAGIMSFGGLLRPLTEHGLGAGQVVKMLGYFMPAMQTYSLPVAALFATTMVYGRLSADNEITACRAAGISMGPFGVAFPALVLGVVVMIGSGVFLYFIVPIFTLKVEKVIYSNLAQLVESQITRTHRIEMNPGSGQTVTIFAQEAHVIPAPPSRPKAQVVELISPVFVTYEPGEKDHITHEKAATPPLDFYMAREAKAYITQDEETGEVYLQADLENGIKFPRKYRGGDQQAMQATVDNTSFFSDPMDSPVRENTKFMPYATLKELLAHPENSRRLKAPLNEFIRDDQQEAYLKSIQQVLSDSPTGEFTFVGGGEKYRLRNNGAAMTLKSDRLIIGELKPSPTTAASTTTSSATNATTVPTTDPESLNPTTAEILGPGNTSKTLPRFTQTNVSHGLDVTAREIVIRATPTVETMADGTVAHRMIVDVEMNDAVVDASQTAAPSPRRRFSLPRNINVEMPERIAAMEKLDLKTYLKTFGTNNADRLMRLQRDETKLTNSITSELYARTSFSVSCLILVLVGAALGMMFKSGNFLSAFALSVVPAGMCILLIITGQHTCENVPINITHFNNPLSFGLAMIWTGNGIVAVLAVILLGRLKSQ